MAKILSKGFKLAESLLEQVDSSSDAIVRHSSHGGDSVAVAMHDVDARTAALDAQVQDLHRQLAEQRATITDLRHRLSKADPSAVEAAAATTSELYDEISTLKHLLAQEKDSRAAAVTQLKSENDVLAAALERERLSVQAIQLSSHRMETRYTLEVEALQRQLDAAEHGAAVLPVNNNQSLSTALEQELHSERRRRVAYEQELLTTKRLLAETSAEKEQAHNIEKVLRAQLAAAVKESNAMRTNVQADSIAATERRLVDTLARLAKCEVEREASLSELRSNRHLIGELRLQLQETRLRAEDLSAEKSSRSRKVVEQSRTFVDELLVSILRVLTKNNKARYAFAAYLVTLHVLIAWVASFHSTATSHGHHQS